MSHQHLAMLIFIAAQTKTVNSILWLKVSLFTRLRFLTRRLVCQCSHSVSPSNLRKYKR
jgi:hypothetical protein